METYYIAANGNPLPLANDGTVVEQARDINQDGERRWHNCAKCEYGEHICGGCGKYLTHSGHEIVGNGWHKHKCD